MDLKVGKNNKNGYLRIIAYAKILKCCTFIEKFVIAIQEAIIRPYVFPVISIECWAKILFLIYTKLISIINLCAPEQDIYNIDT